MRVDLTVIGAGIVGLACARALQRRHPRLRVLVLEKDADVARQQSGHNSGVLHSGIYYAPGSAKARLCREGREEMLRACREWGVAHRLSGKVIVARGARETGRLDELERRGRANGLEGLERIGPGGIGRHEPAAAGDEGLWVPEAGVVDFPAVCERLAAEIVEGGGTIELGARLRAAVATADGLRLEVGDGASFETAHLLNCAGLHADRVARACGAEVDLRVVPFRGEYWRLSENAASKVRGLIYPVPDPTLPFLGVHLTRDVHGRVDAGPNAVLALAREGYRARDVEARHLVETLSYPGFWRLGRRHWRHGWIEMRRAWRPARLLADLRRLVPSLEAGDLRRAGAGVRAQVVGRDGRLVDDFHFVSSQRALHVLNAPSPAATASLAIAKHVAKRASEEFALA